MSSMAVRQPTFRTLVESTVAAEVTAIALSHAHYRSFLLGGESGDAMVALAASHGVEVVDVEALFRVLEPDPDGRTAAFAQQLFEVADAFGAASVGTHSNFDGNLDAAAQRLGELADRAARYGLALGVEPVSVMGLGDLETAWDVVARTGRSNVGLVLDTWHFYRGAGTLDMVVKLPPGAIRTVQISDGTAVPPAGMDYLTDTLANRLVPGEGEFDLESVIRCVDASGSDVAWDMEICSTELDALPGPDAAIRAAQATRGVLAAARRPPSSLRRS
jgi:sugar phosphate isomerase/epimerase